MLQITAKHKIFIGIQPVDFRCGIDGLSGYCNNKLRLEPFSVHIFVFRNRTAKAIKILVYDSQGFCLFTKRLSQGKFNWWPKSKMHVEQLSISKLNSLLWNEIPELTRPHQWRSITDKTTEN